MSAPPPLLNDEWGRRRLRVLCPLLSVSGRSVSEVSDRRCPECGQPLVLQFRAPYPEVNSSLDCPSGHRWRLVDGGRDFALARWTPDNGPEPVGYYRDGTEPPATSKTTD